VFLPVHNELYQLFSCKYSMMKKQLMLMTVKGIRTENKLKQSRFDENFFMHTRSNETKKKIPSSVGIYFKRLCPVPQPQSFFETLHYIQHTLQNDFQTYTLCYTTRSFFLPFIILLHFYPNTLKPKTPINNLMFIGPCIILIVE